MSDVVRTAGTAGTFTYTLTSAPTGAPTLTIFSDAAMTVVAVPAALMTAVSATVFTGVFPASLVAGTYYLRISSPFAGGPYVDTDDRLLLTTVGGSVAQGMLCSLDRVKTLLNRTDTLDDAELTRIIVAASALVDERWGPFLPRVVTERHRVSGSLVLASRSAQAVLSVTGSSVVDPSGYQLDVSSGVLRFVSTPPADSYGRVTVVYSAGPSSVPENVAEAVADIVATHFSVDQQGMQDDDPDLPTTVQRYSGEFVTAKAAEMLSTAPAFGFA